jgi:UDP-N-acetyl-D-mannosaminuronic acid dehydrogenase
VNILQPGCGVGGHCIAVDPYFIISEFPEESKIISNAREINNYKSDWCVEKIKSTALQFEIDNNRKPTIALMGLAFKPNIDDLRESPAKYIAQKVLQNDSNGNCFIVEPNIKEHNEFKLTNYNKAVEQADIVTFLVAHDEFKTLRLTKDTQMLDFCGIIK